MPVTPTEMSGSQLTYQLRLYAEDVVDLDALDRPHADAIYSVMLAAAEYIDYLQGQVVAMEERTPRPMLVKTQPPFATVRSDGLW